jgi:molecular chaperone DnaK
MPQIEVTFDIDANGILHVSAKDKATGKEQAIRIQASGGLSDEDIERMVKDGEANAEADKKRREAVEARNQADTLIHQTEKNLSEYGDKISASDKEAVEKDIQALKDVMDSGEPETIKEKTNALMQSSMKLGEAVYKAQQSAEGEAAGADGQGAQAGGSSDETVVDADFEEVDDKKDQK